MPKQSVTVLVFNEENQILLIQRQDLGSWAFPGGGIESGETAGQAAIREAEEESGYQIKLEGQVGEYLRPQLEEVRQVFRGKIIGGQAIQCGPETRRVAWFNLDNLPLSLNRLLRQFIWDALEEGNQPVKRVQRFNLWEILLVWFMSRLRDLRNVLSKSAQT